MANTDDNTSNIPEDYITNKLMSNAEPERNRIMPRTQLTLLSDCQIDWCMPKLSREMWYKVT